MPPMSASLTSSQVANSTNSYYGSSAAVINISSYSTAESRLYQDIDLSKLVVGQTYTASVYVQVQSCSNVGDNGGAFLQIRCSYNDGASSTAVYSERLNQVTSTDINNGWRRLTATFTVPTGVTRCYVAVGVQKAVAKAYFDAVQVEKGSSVNDFNLLENPGFEQGTAKWTASAAAHGNTSSTYVRRGSLGYRLTGDPSYASQVSQTVNLPANATESDSFIVSTWAKVNAVSPIAHTETNKPKFGIGVTIKYSDNTTVERFSEGNYSVTEPQFLAFAFNLDDGNGDVTRTPKTITVFVRYYYQASGNPNKAYFDDFSLVKEDVPTYKYNSKGNLVSVSDSAKRDQNITYAANGTDVSQFKDAESNIYNYTYDSKHNMTCATSTNGVKYNYSYDAFGNMIGLTVNSSNTSESISSTISYTDNNSLVGSVTDASGNQTTYTYISGMTNNVKDPKGN